MLLAEVGRAAVLGWAVTTVSVPLGIDRTAWQSGSYAGWAMLSVLGLPAALAFRLGLGTLVHLLPLRSRTWRSLAAAALAPAFVALLSAIGPEIARTGSSDVARVAVVLFFLGPMTVSEVGYGVLAVIPGGLVAGALMSGHIGK